MGPPMGFRGTRDKTFFVCGIGAKIVTGLGIQISAGYEIGH